MSTDQTPERAELRQKLAAIEHERWADWQKWCHKVLRERLGDNNMPLEIVLERWERQIRTPYDQLTDQEKASDMEQVDRYWQLVQDYADRQTEKAIRLTWNKSGEGYNGEYSPDHFEQTEQEVVNEVLAELHQTGRSEEGSE